MVKDFGQWLRIKAELDIRQDLPTFQEREIWWCSIGLNVGFEILGKDEKFTRPVLILRKYSRSTFFGLPLTSKRKQHPYHYHLNVAGKEGSVLLDQGRTIDSRRLTKKISKLNENDAVAIKGAFIGALLINAQLTNDRRRVLNQG